MNFSVLNRLLPVPFLAWGLIAATAPGITAGDSGELATAALFLGPAHPPGYPLYVLLGRLFTFLDAGTPAFRLSVLSCLSLAFSYPFLAYAIENLFREKIPEAQRRIIAALTAFFVLTGPLVLAQAVSPEVYAFHFLLSAALLCLFSVPGTLSFRLSFFIAGLALAHHPLILLAAPAFLMVFWDRLGRPKALSLGLAFLFIGLSPYLVLPLRAHFNPVANWGDPDNLDRFLRHLTRAQYGEVWTRRSLLNGVENLGHYLKAYLWETWVLGVLAAVLAFKIGNRRIFLPFLAVFGGLLFVLPFFLHVDRDPSLYAVIDAFFPPAVLWASPLMAAGAVLLFQRTSRRVLHMALWVLLLSILTFRAAVSWIHIESNGNLAVERIGRDHLLTLPRGAALYSRGDVTTFALFYLKSVLHLRPDAFLTDRTGGTFGDAYSLVHNPPGDLYGTITATEKAWERERACPAAFYTETPGAPGRTLKPLGLLYLADREPAVAVEEGLWRRYREPGAAERDEFFTRAEGGAFHLFRGWWLMRRGFEKSAKEEFSKTIRLAGDNSHVLFFLGLLYVRQGWNAEAEGLFTRILRFAPRYVEAMFRLGSLAEDAGRAFDAEERYRRCLRWDPYRSDIRNDLAVLYMGQSRTDDAVMELNHVIQEDPGFPEAYKNLALALWSLDRPRAKTLLAKYLELKPDAPDRAAIQKALQ